MQVIKIINDIMGVNTYVIYNEQTREAAVIDPSFDFEKLKRCVLQENLSVKAILLTHGHYDHIAGLERARSEFKAPVYIGEHDDELLNNPSLNLSAAFGHPLVCTKADKLLNDGEVLSVAGMKIKVIATPGHTKGGVTYACENVLFTGDTLFHLSVGRTDFPGGDFDEIISSLKKLAALDEYPDYTVNPGHDSSSSLDFEITNNPYMS